MKKRLRIANLKKYEATEISGLEKALCRLIKLKICGSGKLQNRDELTERNGRLNLSREHLQGR